MNIGNDFEFRLSLRAKRSAIFSYEVMLMFFGPALTAAWRATTLEVTRASGRYDAVVIGAGAAGGIAALSLTEGGLRVLVLDAGLTATRSPIRSLARDLTRSL